MGLDMYLYAVSKMTEKETKRCTGFSSPAEFRNDGFQFFKFYPGDDSRKSMEGSMYSDLLPYGEFFRVKEKNVMMNEVRAHFNLPDDFEVFGQCNNPDGSIIISGYMPDGETKECKLTARELDELRTEKDIVIFAFKSREIAYWRKAYDVANYICQNAEKTIENCGYYEIQEDVITHALEMRQPSSIADQPELKVNEVYFYHEWY